jgi:Na+/H+ antiporter NhaD/arsenite permease-like protein
MIEAVSIFAMTYIIISGKKSKFLKVGRPAGVMLGAVLMVVARVIEPEEAYGLVNWDTIVLLLGMMIIIEHLAEAEFFKIIAGWVNNKNLSLKKLLFLEVLGLGLLAGFLVNDIVCIFFTPLLLIMIRERNLPPMPFLLALATSTNIGGVIAFTGNPQNMIIGNLSNIPYYQYFLLMLPIGVIGLIINYFLILKIYKKELSNEPLLAPIDKNVEFKPRLKRSIAVTIGVIIGFFLFSNLAWVAISGATLLLFLSNRDEAKTLSKLDWNLLLFFAALFVVIGALSESGVTDMALSRIDAIFNHSIGNYWLFGLVTVIGSNLFANVPYVIIMSESILKLQNPDMFWYILAFTSTIAGNLTIIGAVANVIVVEKSRDVCDIHFLDFIKFGIPSTVLNFIFGMVVLGAYSIVGII